MFKRKKIISLVILSALLFIIIGAPVLAQTPPIVTSHSGDYTLDDMVNIFVKVAAWIMAVSGSLMLLMFIYGGVLFLISAGSQERIDKGKKALSAAVVGMAIILLSYVIIYATLEAMGITPGDSLRISF